MRIFFATLSLGLLAAACSPETDLSEIDASSGTLPVFSASPDEAIKIVGSSTVAPFSTTVAEQFGAISEYPTPIVETTGTGGGFKAFCNGIGPDQPSISNASRRVKDSELELCRKAGVTEIVEIKIGFDGIVLANAKGAPELNLSKAEIYRALAAELPDGQGGWVKNPNKTWADVADHLPDMPILVSGPPPTSGTRDAFAELALEGGAEEVPEMAAIKETDGELFAKKATTIRNDGAWIDSGENDTAIVQTLMKNDDSIGIMGYSFLEQNLDRLKGAHIEGTDPTFQQIASGAYGISRSMFFYVKKQNVPLVPGIEGYINEFTQEDAWGPTGYLVDKGLIPLSAEERKSEREHALALEVMEPAES
ncbi:substrate-binding domain-containing protein [Henriciella aquimarina]|uniref:substrate-binding domain-containing protein n=1 Tax=Henriciella aquimarina TaxID=545261 RepID=UPI000A054FDF|nr:substrate-binding domain-containing protein [Henriciella aquimarina]